MPYRSRYRRSHHPSRAEQHILEAQSLHQKYGGAFDQVKGQFLSLDGQRMHSLLDAYGERYGPSARAYAYSSLAKWRSGQVTMAGQTMTRLFDLLPRFMENEEKLALIRTLRAQALRRLHRNQIRLRIDDRRSLVHVAQQVMGMVARVGQIEIPPDFVEVQGWMTQGDAQALNGMARDMERFVAVQRLADLLIQLGTISRLRPLAQSGLHIKVETHFEIPTASVDIRFGRGFWRDEEIEPMADGTPGESDQDFLGRLQELALRQEHQDGALTYIEYVMKTLTPREQEQLRALAAAEGLRTDILLQELRIKTIAARGDIDATIATAERLKQAGQNSKITSEHATASGTTRIEIENKKRPCYVATACYGDAEHPDVVALRHFRDETLRRSVAGRAFIWTYELLSPPLAMRLGPRQWVGGAVRRVVLEPLVRLLNRVQDHGR